MFRKQFILLISGFTFSLPSYTQTQEIIFKPDGSGNNYTVVHNFDKMDGGNPVQVSLVQAGDGRLYGMTFAGGVHDKGVLFQYDPVTSAYIKKFEFDSVNGSTPHGSLIQASDGMLYGMTCNGGAHDMGVLFQYDPVTSAYTKKLDFTGTGKGSFPRGSLVQATDGLLYGLTNNGGVHDMGVLFQYDPATGSCIKKFDFDGVNGISPRGSLIQASNGMLYGMTYEGGANFVGVIFQYNPLTSACVKKFDFDGALNGRLPFGSLLQAKDGMLYGMTGLGGAHDQGVLFQYNTLTSIYTKKLDFNSTVHGSNPTGALIQNSDGTLYGLTSAGGATDHGVLFQYDPALSDYSKKFEFDFVQGSLPNGYLVKAKNGLLYGMTYGGGVNDLGVIFKYDSATGTSIAESNFLNSVHVFPNPAGGKVELQCMMYDVQSNTAEIIVYNFLGEKVYTSQIAHPVSYVDLSSQPKGVYFLKVKTADGVGVKKIVKQ